MTQSVFEGHFIYLNTRLFRYHRNTILETFQKNYSLILHRSSSSAYEICDGFRTNWMQYL